MPRQPAVDTAFTDSQQSPDAKPWQFKPGESGNPAGRPKGSRNKLGEAMLHDLLEYYDQHGKTLIAKVADDNPAVFLQALMKLLPRQTEAALEVSGKFQVLDLGSEQKRRIAESWLLSQQNEWSAISAEASSPALPERIEVAVIAQQDEAREPLRRKSANAKVKTVIN